MGLYFPRLVRLALMPLILAVGLPCCATVFGNIRGVVHDPQHHPVSGAHATLQANDSAYNLSAETNNDGEFHFDAVPLGSYTINVDASGFAPQSQVLVVVSGSAPVLHYQLAVASAKQEVTVTASPEDLNPDSPRRDILISHEQISRYAGVDASNSFKIVTEFVPGSYMVHDQLHVRGGHQVTWAIDGVPIPNTNIASNVGPQFNPKDVSYLQAETGSYAAEYGDRTYGVFNVAPNTGFERNRQCDLLISAGNYYQTDDQISCGGHTQKFAYYASLNGNRSNYGLQTPIPQVVHDAQNGYGGFASFIINHDPKNQYRVVTSLRQDYYQIPIDPDPNSTGNQILVASGASPSYGLHDAEREPDGYAIFSWVHTFNSTTLLTLSPFYHYNAANYQGGPNDYPVSTTVNQVANYLGLQGIVNKSFWRNDLEAGVYGFYQHQHNYFDNQFTDGTPNYPPSSISVNGGVAEEFFSDRFNATKWLTIIGGLRQTEFRSTISENATDPRIGVAVRIPRLNWVLRAFYGQYYQPPPLATATGSLFGFANSQNLTFSPLQGERDEQWEASVIIPYRGWNLEVDNYQTKAKNWLDHNNIGESNLFWPITWYGALIQGWDLTLRSPILWHRAQFHLVYANQIAQATSPITGGLICPAPVTEDCPLYIPPGYSPVDHDQRNTLNIGANTSLPWHSYASGNVYYGSGFVNGLYGTPQSQYPGTYLPSHTTVDLSVGKSFAEGKFNVSVTALNVANLRVQLDNSLTFGGFHWNEPRQIYMEFRWRFHY